MAHPALPRFALYGEPDRTVSDHFIHIETIERRSAAYDWTIRPHSHALLDHLFLIRAGGGEMLAEGERHNFGPAILVIPAGLAHGFAFVPGTIGHVVTVASALMRHIAGEVAPIARLREAATVLPIAASPQIDALLAGLMAETVSEAPLAASASEALLRLLLVAACRALPAPGVTGDATPPRRAALLVGRYAEQVERHLRDNWTIADHAKALGTSVARLRACCVEVTGHPPIHLAHDRLFAEARRQLAYTDRTIAEIGYDLGFTDPAYFSRFFRHMAGVAPSRWRDDTIGPPVAA
ncbi:helix-turn-helix domain-containing protein [Sphingomonas naphthae]|uniref:Helix-turn-helix domain-containing protein n=1 Tax=Sphingomonas naphthae TaxID=1813468 RepID=A0ABY7TPE7_9SPHN|nr:helix-turn-helix domain-containing protein [Sphingomonas naphthae]WCT75095.1 helix-turn-helix domain-containing protein [Sphingomonas naphthae]